MRIAIDARELSGKPTGVGRYLAGLLREWTAPGATHGHQILLYAHARITALPGLETRIVPGAGGTRWEQMDLPRQLARDEASLCFSPAYSTPLLTRIPRVVALHDISFVAHPEWFGWREGLRRRILARRSAAAARAVVTISQFSKSEIVSRMQVAPGKVHVIPPGVDCPVPDDQPRGFDAGMHVLFVGSIFNRRHVPDLIAAFSTMVAQHPDAHLHLVGDNRSYPFEDVERLVQQSAVSERIRWHRYVSDADLTTLYGSAHAFAFLSEYEGLGLTPLEALSAGIPSLLLDTAVAHESCGGAALYTHRGDVGSIAAALERLLYDHQTRQALLGAAPTVLARYDWARAASGTLALLEEVA